MPATATNPASYLVTGDGLEGRLHETFTGKSADTIARRLFGREAFTRLGEFVGQVDVYLPLKQRSERDARKVTTTGRVYVGTMWAR